MNNQAQGTFGAEARLTCRELIEALDHYVEGMQANEEREIFEQHLKVCKACRQFLETYRATMRLSKEAFADGDAPVPTNVPEDLVKAILKAKGKIE